LPAARFAFGIFLNMCNRSGVISALHSDDQRKVITMIRLSQLLDIMIWNGGWFDTETGHLIKDRIKRISKTVYTYIHLDCHENIIDITKEPDRYVRIPYLCPMKYSQYILNKHGVRDEVLEQFGISECMNNQYSVLNHSVRREPVSASDKHFIDQSGRLQEVYDLDYPDVREYALNSILDWCMQNKIDIVDDTQSNN
jgi:hypothetical protein